MTVENDRLTERLARLEAECHADRQLTEEKFRGRDLALALQAEPNRLRFEAHDQAIAELRSHRDEDKGGQIGRREIISWAAAGVGIVAAAVGFTR